MTDNRIRYRIVAAAEYEALLLRIIKENRYIGMMWPNREDAQFDLLITEEELLMLKLKVPLTVIHE